jgi:hypothetical protein
MKNKYVMCAVLMCLWSACADDPQPNATDMAVVDQGADMRVMMDMSVVEPPKKGLDEPCSTTSDCERGLGCSPAFGTCTYRSSCLVEWLFGTNSDIPGDEGCIVEASSGGLISAKECEVDADCKGNPTSERCQFRICQDYADCVTDSDCPAPQVCFGQTDNDITRVCTP